MALKPDIATLDLNTMFSGTAVVINTPENITIMANEIYGAGVKPELEVFDSGDIHLAHDLLAKGVLKGPPLFQIVMGVRFGFNASVETLAYAKSLLPKDAVWAAFASAATNIRRSPPPGGSAAISASASRTISS